MTEQPQDQPQEPSEEQLRAAYESEIKRITVTDVVLQTTISLVNLAGRKLGLAQGTEDERDLGQAREAIDAARALLPLLERHEDLNAAPIREALSQLQLAYAREAGAPAPAPADAKPPAQERQPGEQQPAAAKPGEGKGPAQASGRLWVPGS